MKLRTPKSNRGFTLIEMLVTISIIAIISSIVLFNFPSFSSKIVLENLTHEIALIVRQAQVFGIGIKRQIGTAETFPSYGAHFDLNTPTEVIFFADINTDGIYNNPPDVDVETFIIQRGNKISALCYNIPCIDVPSSGERVVDITFKRPDPEANIYVEGVGVGLSVVQITVSPSDGVEIGDRYITVWSSGQIAVTSVE